MEEFPEELRTPPVALVSLVGYNDLHASISTHLHTEQPPINTLALPDFSKISVISKNRKERTSVSLPPVGILKRDWLLKHRTKIPAVVGALFYSDHISGDPAQWLQVCTDLENLKAVIQGRNIKLVLIIVLRTSYANNISEDRMTALRKRAEVDSKYVVNLVLDDGLQLKQSLMRLGNTFAELANVYYRDEGRRVKTRIEKKSFGSIELNIRYCFKAAVYAEFRRDWVEALRLYEDAYRVLREMIGTSTRMPPIQRLVEIKYVAEQLNFKISTLQLHGGKITEAIIWFRQHNAAYSKLVGSTEVAFLHWEWLSRQFLVFAELLETSSAAAHSISSPVVSGAADKPTEWEFYPSHYYQSAAQHLMEKRSCLEFGLSMLDSSNDVDGNVDSVVSSAYVGQFAQLLEHGDAFEMRPLTDEEYSRYALSEGKRFQDSFEIIALLKKSYEAYKNMKAHRLASYCGFQMAREHYAMSEFDNAIQLFGDVANLYRQEGWVDLLWEVLGYLRECSRKLGSVQGFIEYSLEMAALPVSTIAGPRSFKDCGPAGPASLPQREVIHKEVFGLIREESGIASNKDDSTLQIGGDCSVHLEIDLVSPLRVRLQSAAISNIQPGHRVETATCLSLATNKWLRLTYDIKSEQSGKLECIYVIARIGAHFSICCRAESPASMNDLPLWKFEDRVESSPTKDRALSFSGQKATQVEEADPQVDLNLGSSGPALVGESFIVPVTVASKGHAVYSGEIKINLVDTRVGGLMSPREEEPFSADALHVELLGISGQDESQIDNDTIRKIQHSFGLITVPFLNDGDLWSFNIEIRWHRPKPVMLYVSLSYSPQSIEPAAPKVHVHKNMEIEGKTAVEINHRYMLPFRRDPLLLSTIKQVDSDQLTSLPMNETSMLIAIAKNCTEVPLQVLSMTIEVENDEMAKLCTVQEGCQELVDPALLVPAEEFKKVFTITPELNHPKFQMGTVCLRWRRKSKPGEKSDSSTTAPEVVTRYRLPDVKVELPPLVVSLECPPHAILGDPFTYFVRIKNLTELLQEIKFSLADSQSFVLCGPHSDTIFVLPKTEKILSYKLVPLVCGFQQLPRVTVTSLRYFGYKVILEKVFDLLRIQ
ncbi:Trafficking protein particle complex subunit 11 [Heracleum sosnowskyi]|uniref:Trafficking protein particle complex subunit 11 n=1 Tax=Heracleum sosnowskyi TaxID=360622 RepID=A0AAD8H8S0_9APIA|nr:Trafficking protein particle complex subunit 11 [Heracleum sosnowskyi]